MSITSTPTDTSPRNEGFDCNYDDCDTNEPAAHGPVGAYCSKPCQARDRGRRLLALFEHDHRYCATCFRPLKVVDDVPEWRRSSLGPVTERAATGFQSLTEHAERGEVARRRDAYQFETRIGVVCECGNANTREREALLQRANVRAVVRQLYESLETLREEGQHDKRVDLEALIAALRSQVNYGSGLDFEYAVGVAVDGEGDR
ncbi:hypothetical protein [Halobacterium sp. KA-6]|uniref:hypothetical protein n=1 Tax=Halobacterium sp. KA-6 TaxID=2896368 RepID=UPI001E3D3FD4|nr:hypothetical protein [Halobacterium sp. KA-6]MCD2204425.1 hypothetical protein [Halobacterium sp. KA-6]